MWAYGLWLLFDYYCSFNGLLLNAADGRLMVRDGTVINGSRITPTRGECWSRQGGKHPSRIFRISVSAAFLWLICHLRIKKKKKNFNSTSTTQGLKKKSRRFRFSSCLGTRWEGWGQNSLPFQLTTSRLARRTSLLQQSNSQANSGRLLLQLAQSKCKGEQSARPRPFKEALFCTSEGGRNATQLMAQTCSLPETERVKPCTTEAILWRALWTQLDLI